MATPTINLKINANYVDNVQAAKTPVPNKLVPLDATGKFPLSVIPKHNHYGQTWSGSATNGLSVMTSSTSNGTAALYGRQGAGSGSPTYAAGVWGDSFDSLGVYGSSTSGYGVEGTSTDWNGVGGSSVNGDGVVGRSMKNVGVLGSSGTGYAMYSLGGARQSRGGGGWVKALLHLYGGSVSRCYNSQGTSPNSTVPCGFTLTKNANGDYTIDFGFQVNDRFISVTPEYAGGIPVIPVFYFPGANQVRVKTYKTDNTLVDSAFSIVVY